MSKVIKTFKRSDHFETQIIKCNKSDQPLWNHWQLILNQP